jgi:hypothetical protein
MPIVSTTKDVTECCPSCLESAILHIDVMSKTERCESITYEIDFYAVCDGVESEHSVKNLTFSCSEPDCQTVVVPITDCTLYVQVGNDPSCDCLPCGEAECSDSCIEFQSPTANPRWAEEIFFRPVNQQQCGQDAPLSWSTKMTLSPPDALCEGGTYRHYRKWKLITPDPDHPVITYYSWADIPVPSQPDICNNWYAPVWSFWGTTGITIEVTDSSHPLITVPGTGGNEVARYFDVTGTLSAGQSVTFWIEFRVLTVPAGAKNALSTIDIHYAYYDGQQVYSPQADPRTVEWFCLSEPVSISIESDVSTITKSITEGDTATPETVTITNTGDKAVFVDFENFPDWMTADRDSFSIGPGESVAVEFTFDTDSMPVGSENHTFYVAGEDFADIGIDVTVSVAPV